MKVFVRVKSAGKKKRLAPISYEISDSVQTLRGFLSELVSIEAERYNTTGVDTQVIPFLTAEEIDAQAQVGKVSFGRIYSDKTVDVSKAIANALQCQEDGLVRVFQNETELEHLDDAVTIQDGDTFTLIRLTFLAGRMW